MSTENISSSLPPGYMLHDISKEAAQAKLQKLNIPTEDYYSKLIEAEEGGNIELLHLLLAAGTDVNHTDNKGKTPLINAAENGHAECVQLLLAAGADVNHADNEGKTPLINAAKNGHAECVQHLIAAPGIDVNKVENRMEKTALFEAAYEGHIECVKVLLTAPAIDITKRNKFHVTPHRTTENKEIEQLLLSAIKNRIIKAQEELEKRGISCNEYEQKLLDAAYEGNAELMQLLITVGTNINAKDINGATPLYWASYQGHTECVKLILSNEDYFIQVNQGPHYDETPLKVAKNEEIKQLLRPVVKEEAQSQLQLRQHITPEKYNTALLKASQNDNRELITLLITAGADISQADEYGETPLYKAAYLGHTECVKLLIDAGADVNKANKKGETPLYMAEERGHTECAELLRAAGGNCGGIVGFCKRLFS